MARTEQPKTTGEQPEHCVSSQAKVAAFFGLSGKTVKEWGAKGCPGKTKHGYDLAAITRWRIERLQARDDRSPLATRLQEAKVQVAEATAKIKGVEADMRVGAVVPRAEVEAQSIARNRVLKQALMRIPAETAPLLVGKTVTPIKDALRERLTRTLKAYIAKDPARK